VIILRVRIVHTPGPEKIGENGGYKISMMQPNEKLRLLAREGMARMLGKASRRRVGQLERFE